MGQGGPHVPWRNCTQSATWMVWPTGLGHLPPSYLCPGGAWWGGLLDTEVLHCPSVSPSTVSAGCGWEGEGVRTPLVGLRTICVWDWGSYLLGAWTSGPECVTYQYHLLILRLYNNVYPSL